MTLDIDFPHDNVSYQTALNNSKHFDETEDKQ